MRERAQLQRFAIFFFLAFLDERLAAEIADRAAAAYKVKNPKKLDANSPQMRLLTIELCRTFWESNKKRMSRQEMTAELQNYGKLPKEIDLQPWIKFHKQTPDEEIVAFILAQVLKFSEQEVAEALKISIGTLRHRVSRAIRVLGGFAPETLSEAR